MAIVSNGQIIEASWSNPSVGSGFLFPMSEESSTYDIGGFRNDNTTDGAGRLITSKKRMPGMFEMVAANDMGDTQEYEAMVALSNSLDETTWTFTTVNGITYKGVGTIDGDLKLDVVKGSFSMKVAAGLGFQQQ